MNSKEGISKIPPWTLLFRTISRILLEAFFPTKIIDETQALQKAIARANEGRGLVIVFTHFSLRDAMEVNRSIIFKNPVLKNREVINPLALHQYNKFLELVGKFYHGTFAPIVNNSTLAKKGYEHLPRGKGLSEFISASIETLHHGGVVTLALNATRKDRLDLDDPQKPIGYFIVSLQSKGTTDFGILIVGFGVEKAENYSKKEVGGMNFGKTYVINIGKYFTLEELLAKPMVGGKVSNIDMFLRREMAKIVPKEYL